MTVLNEIRLEAARITAEQMEGASRGLPEVEQGEVLLGAVSAAAVRLFTLAYIYEQRRSLCAVASMINADPDADERQGLQEMTARANFYLEIAHDLAWAQVHADLGTWMQNLGLRRDWVIVAVEEETREDLLKDLAQAIQVAIFRIPRHGRRKDEKERKPQ